MGKICTFGIAELWEAQRTLHQSAGGLQRLLGSFCCLFLESEHELNGAQSQTCPPGRHPRVSPELQICIDASPMDIFMSSFGQLWAPQNAFPSGWQGVQNRCGHSNEIHVLLNPILRSNSAPPLKNLSLAATAIPKRWGKGRKKGFFTANWE